MSEEKLGIKELKEALVGAQDLAVLIIKNLKDGLQLGKDVAAVVAELLSNEELKASLAAAAEGISKVPAEVKDLEVSEVLDLVGSEVEQVKKILEALKS